MSRRRQALKSPGSPPLSEKRDLYIELMSKGMSNSAACRVVGINWRTGSRWRRGRTMASTALASARTYAPVIEQRPRGSDRFLSEAERILIADGVLAGLTVQQSLARSAGARPPSAGRFAATAIP